MGDSAPSPKPNVGGRLLALGRDAVSHFLAHDGFVLAGHLAFMGLLSLFPFLIFLVALAGFVGQTDIGTQMVAFLLENLPESVAGTLEQPIIEVMQDTRGGLLTVGILAALWTASNGLESLRTALNRAYDAPERPPYLRRRAESVVLVMVASAVVMTGMASLVFGGVLWDYARDYAGLARDVRMPWRIARWGLSVGLLFTAIVALYRILPARRLRWRWVLPGASVALALWLGAGSLFSLYLRHFNQYALTYGSLGGVVIAMIFFYILGIIFIFGAEVNAALARAEGWAVRG